MNLAGCLSRAKNLDAAEKQEILTIAQGYKDAGMPPAEAELAAIDDQIEGAYADRAEVIQEIAKAGGQLPPPRKAPERPAPIQAEPTPEPEPIPKPPKSAEQLTEAERQAEAAEQYRTSPEEEAAIVAKREAETAERRNQIDEVEAERRAAEQYAAVSKANKSTAVVKTKRRRVPVRPQAETPAPKPVSQPAPKPPVAKKPAPEKKVPEKKPPLGNFASHKAREYAQEKGIPEAEIRPTGKKGKIVYEDVLRVITRRQLQAESELLKQAMKGGQTLPSPSMSNETRSEVALGRDDASKRTLRVLVNADKERRQVNAEEMIDEVLEDLSPSDPFVPLLKRIRQLGVNDVWVAPASDYLMAQGREGTPPLGLYLGTATQVGGKLVPNRLIMLNEKVLGKGPLMRVLTHELVHAVTAPGTTTNNKFAKRLDQIRQDVIEHLIETKQLDKVEWLMMQVERTYDGQTYGLQNVDEFLAEALTSVEFQILLESIPSKTDNTRALLSDIWRAIRDFLGFGQEYDNVLAEVLTLTEGVMQEQGQALTNTAKIAAKRLDPIATTIPEDQAPTDEDYADWARGSVPLDEDRAPVRKVLQSLASPPIADLNDSVSDAIYGTTGIDTAEVVRGTGRLSLGLHTTDQIIRRFKNLFDQVPGENALSQYWKGSRRKVTIARRLQHTAEGVNQRWKALERVHPKAAMALSKLMHDATISDIHPDLAFYNVRNKHAWDRKGAQDLHKNLKKTFNDMPPAARALYRDVRDYYQDQRRMVRESGLRHLADSVGGPQVLSQRLYAKILAATKPEEIAAMNFGMLKDIAGAFEASLTKVVSVTSVPGPYFPLRRFGKYVIEAKKKLTATGPIYAKRGSALQAAQKLRSEDPLAKIKTLKNSNGEWQNFRLDRFVEMVDNITEANRIAADYNSKGFTGPKGKPVAVTLRENWTIPPGGEIGILIDQATKKLGEGSPEAQAMQIALVELMAEGSMRKAELRRKKVAGASLDMRRAFAERAFAGSWAIADLDTALEISNATRDMARVAKDTSVQAQEVVQELRLRDEKSIVERKVSAFDRIAGRLGFVWYLASPSYAVVNATQVPLVALPYLGGKYGAVAANAEITKAYRAITGAAVKEVARIRAGFKGSAEGVLDQIRKQLLPDEQRMIDELLEDGIIDATFMQELYETTQGKGSMLLKQSGARRKAGAATAIAFEVARTLPQSVEIVNRVVVAKAAYNLARQKGLNHEAATEAASEAVLETQFDYSDWNKPRHFKAWPGMRAIMMFKMYGQGIYALLLSNAYRAIRGNTPQSRQMARKVFAGVIASHTMAGGVLGGLAVEPVRWMISLAAMLFEDADDPWDLDNATQEWLYDLTDSQVTAEVVARGLPRAVGFDLFSRVGLNNVLFMGLPDSRSYRDSFQSAIVAAGGPVVAAAENMFAGFDYLRKGEYRRGIEKMVPKGIRDPLKAWGLAADGMLDFNGNPISDPGDFHTAHYALQAMGFTPAEVARTYEGRTAQKRLETAIRDTRKRLMQEWRRSSGASRSDFFRDKIMPFNSRHPQDRITLEGLIKSLTEQRTRAAFTRAGAYTDDFSIRRIAPIYEAE